MLTKGKCRSCGAQLEHTFVNLGLSPLANSYIPADKARSGEISYPLHAFVCGTCFLVQLEEFESPEGIFSDYAYFSSFSSSWLRHCEAYVSEMIDRWDLTSDNKVVEIASNDGYLLQYFVAKGIPALGVEPAANVAKEAIARGVPTEVAFFGKSTATRLRDSGHRADLTAANNVLAHVPDIQDFVGGFAILLKPDGVATFEFPHLLEMIKRDQFDTIYHEHFSYLSLTALRRVFGQNKLRIFDVQRLPTHGGSLRIFVCPESARHVETASVQTVLDDERAAGLADLSGFAGFANRTVDIKCNALEFLIDARRAGKSVLAYGAAAKGNTFLNYCGIGPELVCAVADRSPHKQGTLLPGSRIPVISPEELLKNKPDYVLILPWNLREEIVSELAGIRTYGGRFVTAIPQLTID